MDLVIKEYEGSGEFAKAIEPANNPQWQLLIDHGGIPHLLLRCRVQMPRGIQLGWVAMDDFLPEGSGVQDILEGTFRED